jgi:hypothetical protein
VLLILDLEFSYVASAKLYSNIIILLGLPNFESKKQINVYNLINNSMIPLLNISCSNSVDSFLYLKLDFKENISLYELLYSCENNPILYYRLYNATDNTLLKQGILIDLCSFIDIILY